MTAREFILNLPQKLNKDLLADKTTTFHFKIDGENGGNFTVDIRDGNCTVTEALVGEPKCTVTAKDKNLEGIVSGDINPMMAVMTGKVKFDNQGELLKYAKVFGLM